jgi:hypothetical protein
MAIIANIFAQKNKIAVLDLDVKGYGNYLTDEQAGDYARLEVEKMGQFEVVDKYDVAYVAQKNGLNINGCFGKICLVEIGKLLSCQLMLTGTIEITPNHSIVVSLREIDVQSEKINRTLVKDYVFFPDELRRIISISVREFYGQAVDASVEQRLAFKKESDKPILEEPISRLALGGPRMGFTVFTGELAKIMKDSKQNGGFDAFPAMFQFGYQFERQYLNEGRFQALIEFVPMVTGTDQGYFIPSFTLLNGLRNNKTGFEFAFGPTVSWANQAFGYFDAAGAWHIQDSLTPPDVVLETRLDSRGKIKMSPGFVIIAGKTFRSGRLNIPLNMYAIPSKSGLRFGLSFGFNASKR